MKKITFTLFLISLCSIAKAELINDFECTLNEGKNLPGLFQFQQEWMAAAKKQGFDATYKTRVLLPVYNKQTSTEPFFFVWRGHFRDGKQWGEMMDWFPQSEWAVKFQQVMNCESSSLWNAPY